MILFLMGHLAISGTFLTGYKWVEFRDAAQYLTMHRTIPDSKE